VFAFAVLAFRALFELRAVPEDELVLRGGGRRRRTGALVLVVLGRELINAPRTSSSDCWALTIKKAQPNASATNGVIKILDFISLPLEKTSPQSNKGHEEKLKKHLLLSFPSCPSCLSGEYDLFTYAQP
jgi:hypothetical protein